MDIEFKTKIAFKDIPVGEVFKDYDISYIKIRPIFKDDDCINAISLIDGDYWAFKDDKK